MNLFGKAKSKPSTKDSIMKLREALDMLDKREKFLQARIDRELIIAKENATRNKKLALTALKRKKQLEMNMESIAGQKLTLETQMLAIESANVNLETMNAMRAGAEAMKTIHKDLTIEKVDQTMDEIREQTDLANEIGEAVRQPIGFGLEFDEDELNRELEELEQSELDSLLLQTERPPEFGIPNITNAEPSAVTAPPRPVRVAIAGDEEAELDELRASMAM